MSSQASSPKTRRPPGQPPKSGPGFLIGLGILVLVFGVALITVVIVNKQSDDDDTPSDPQTQQAFGPVEVTGEPLVRLTDPDHDAAVGQPAPKLEGETPAGERVTIDPEKDGPMVLVVVAHWCPHCQVEVPRLVDLVDDNGELDGVKVVAVATASNPQQDNYPPGAWLEREKWPGPVLVDNHAGEAADAYGTSAYPFLVAIDADGNVVARTSGELSPDDLTALFEAARGTASGN